MRYEVNFIHFSFDLKINCLFLPSKKKYTYTIKCVKFLRGLCRLLRNAAFELCSIAFENQGKSFKIASSASKTE